MKRIIWTVGIFLAITLFGIAINFDYIVNSQDLCEAGLVSVEPVKMWGVKNKDGTYYVNDYRIQFVFEIDDHKKYIELNAMEAYETDDFIKVKKLYKKKKAIEGYVYYSKSSNIAYLSKTATNKIDFGMERMKTTFIIMIISEILFILPLWLPFIFEILNIGKLKEDYLKSDSDIVCTYRAYAWGFVMLLWILFIVLMVIATIAVGIGFLILVFMFLGAAIYWILMYINFLFIIHAEGIIFRNFKNQIFRYTYDDIKSYHLIRSNKNRTLYIETNGKSIAINYYCTNYYKAEEWFVKNVKCTN